MGMVKSYKSLDTTLFTDLILNQARRNATPYFNCYDSLSQRFAYIAIIPYDGNNMGHNIAEDLDLYNKDLDLPCPYKLEHVQLLITGKWTYELYQETEFWTFYPHTLLEIRKG